MIEARDGLTELLRESGLVDIGNTLGVFAVTWLFLAMVGYVSLLFPGIELMSKKVAAVLLTTSAWASLWLLTRVNSSDDPGLVLMFSMICATVAFISGTRLIVIPAMYGLEHLYRRLGWAR